MKILFRKYRYRSLVGVCSGHVAVAICYASDRPIVKRSKAMSFRSYSAIRAALSPQPATSISFCAKKLWRWSPWKLIKDCNAMEVWILWSYGSQRNLMFMWSFSTKTREWQEFQNQIQLFFDYLLEKVVINIYCCGSYDIGLPKPHLFYYFPCDDTQSELCYSISFFCRYVYSPVCPSMTFSYRDHIGWNTSKIFSRLNSLRFPLEMTPTWAIWSNGNTSKIGWNSL